VTASSALTRVRTSASLVATRAPVSVVAVLAVTAVANAIGPKWAWLVLERLGLVETIVLGYVVDFAYLAALDTLRRSRHAGAGASGVVSAP
jgi:hypothetical protein